MMSKITREQLIENLKFNDSLAGQDLSGLDLTGIVFSGIDLSMVNLAGADLNGADLSKANLTEAVLVRAILTNAKLSEANLSWAKLDNANLSESELSKASLLGANLNKAELHNAVLAEVNLSLASFNEASLVDAVLTKTNLKKTDFSKADLSGADLKGAEFKHTNLSGAILKGADLRHCKLVRVNLTGADLTGAKLYEIRLSNTGLDNIICEGADFSPKADGSDIRRLKDTAPKPATQSKASITQSKIPQISFISNIALDTILLGGLTDLLRIIRPLSARISKIEEIKSGVSSATFEVAERKNLIPAVMVLFNALMMSGGIDFEALKLEMSKFGDITIDDVSLTELLEDTQDLIDTTGSKYSLLEKFQAGFSGMTADIQGEALSIKYEGEQLTVDYDPSKAAAKTTICSVIAKLAKWLIRN